MSVYLCTKLGQLRQLGLIKKKAACPQKVNGQDGIWTRPFKSQHGISLIKYAIKVRVAYRREEFRSAKASQHFNPTTSIIYSPSLQFRLFTRTERAWLRAFFTPKSSRRQPLTIVKFVETVATLGSNQNR